MLAGVVGSLDSTAIVTGMALSGVGGGVLVWLRGSLRRWAEERRAQMVSLGGVALRLLPGGGGPPPEGGAGGPGSETRALAGASSAASRENGS